MLILYMHKEIIVVQPDEALVDSRRPSSFEKRKRKKR
jgi:hypothetical protein